MSARIDYRKVSPEAMTAMAGLERFIRLSGLEPGLVHLVEGAGRARLDGVRDGARPNRRA